MLSNAGNWLLQLKAFATGKRDNDALPDVGGDRADPGADNRWLPVGNSACLIRLDNSTTLLSEAGVQPGAYVNAEQATETVSTNDATLLAAPGLQTADAYGNQPYSGGILGMPDGAKLKTITPAPAFDGLIVQFNAGATSRDKAAAIASINGRIKDTIRAGDGNAGDLVVVDIGSQLPAKAIQALGSSGAINFFEPNWILGTQYISNDTSYTNGGMWGMYGDQTSPSNAFGSQAGEAWASGSIGKSTTVVGDIDTGIDYTHVDLYQNVWLNQGELPTNLALNDTDADGLITFRDLNNAANSSFVSDLNGNGRIDAGDLLADKRWADGVDNDGNGYVDDLIGWDFVNKDNNPYDDNNHGTHTAGTIGAMGGNGTGVVGVNWNVEIVGLKFLNASGSGAISDAIKALDYYTAAAAKDQSAGWSSEFIGTNNSWGGGGFSQSMQDAITRSAQQDLLFIAAAGNGGSDGIGDNNDLTANYPSNYSTLTSAGFESVVAVAALTSTGGLASYSNYGAKTVDLGAPGSGIVSTVAGGGYASYSGISMATPHVTGAVALEASLHPEYTASQLRDLLLSTTTATSSLTGKSVTGGRLDIGSLINATAPSNTVGVTKYGTTGNDTIVGTDYNDTLAGVPQTGTNLGNGTIDHLTGGLGAYLFLLGDSRGMFYNDGNNKSSGTGDYAVITDFNTGDMLQLKRGNYWFSNTVINGERGNGVYADTNGNRRFDTTDELIGLVQGPASSSISNANIKWV